MSGMSIRADFQADVDEFIGDLESFATGSYLKPEERENWEQPFDPAALPGLKSRIENLLDALDELPDDPTGPVLATIVTRHVEDIDEYNDSFAGAIVEKEEKDELRELIYNAAGATGADDEALAQLPDFS